MRIVHAVNNTAGLPVAFAAAQRQAGHQALALVYDSTFYGLAQAADLGRMLSGNRISRQLRRARLLMWLAANFDIFHFHYHTTFLPDQRDLILLKSLGKTIVFHLHGCDIRDPRRVRAEHAISACAECSIACLTPIKLHMQSTLTRYADAVIVSTPDLLEFVPGAYFINNPLDTREWAQLRQETATRRNGDEIIVAHAPSNRAIKGTHYIEAAIEQLRAENHPVSLRLLEGLPQHELRLQSMDADIVVDQVLVGWFGVFALEMMALGKPVVAYLRDDLKPYQANLPIVSSSPEQLVATLRALITSPAERKRIGELGPQYIEAFHNVGKVNAEVMKIYRSVET